MKATLSIDDDLMTLLEREAAARGQTISEVVELALRQSFRMKAKNTSLPPIPTFNSGGELVDIADRDALYRAMEEDE